MFLLIISLDMGLLLDYFIRLSHVKNVVDIETPIYKSAILMLYICAGYHFFTIFYISKN